jgi:hypothetical protein
MVLDARGHRRKGEQPMTAVAGPRLTAWRPGPRRFLALLCTLLVVGSAAAAVAESMRRREIAERAGKGLAALPPAVLATAGILEDSDGAALIVADGLMDARGSTPASAAAPPSDAAQVLVLETIGRRPASAHARLLLGLSAADDASADRWKRPLELASAAAPGLDRASAALAQKYLLEWPKLSAAARSEAETTLRRAFLDDAFLRSTFRLALQRLGPDAAVGLVPANARALEAASRVAGAAGAARASQLLADRRKATGSEEDSGPRP